MSTAHLRRFGYGLFALLFISFAPALASADTQSVNFENPPYVLGSISGQDGWSNAVNPAYDQGVTTTPATHSGAFGSQSFRISDAVTSGSFGDWVFAKPLTDAVGESASTDGSFTPGTLQPHFEMSFDIASMVPDAEQPSLHISVSPDRGDGSRMSYLRFEDGENGLNVFFDDVQGTTTVDCNSGDTCANFVETEVATGLDRTVPHHVRLTMDTIDGPSNDVVKVYIDNVLVHTGTSWEDYYRYDSAASAEQSPRIVKTVIIQARGDTNNPADLGKGFLIDNLSLLSGPAPVTPPSSVKVTVDKFIDGAQATASSSGGHSFPMSATWNASNIGSGSGSFALGPTGFNSPNPYEAVTSDMTPGASYSANETPDGANVGADCSSGAPYALAGYTSGDTLQQAMSASTTLTAPAFSEMAGDKFIIVWNKTCAIAQPTFIKVHILKYLNGAVATALSAAGYQFPMSSTWTAANLDGGATTSGTYVLGDNFGGAPDLYGADTAPMQIPASYTTSENTDISSQVVASPELCSAGKYLLNGYQSSPVSFADAASSTMSSTPPAFTGISADQYVIVSNSSCPTTGSLTIVKDTTGGDGTFHFTGDGGIGAFAITTVGGTGSITFPNLAPGTYHIAEASTSGWTQIDSDCSVSGIAVNAGGAPECIITNTKNTKLGEIRGTKYEDRDGDGKLSDGDHHRLSGWTIYLDTNNNGSYDPGEPSTVTNAHGDYRFTSLVAGTYHVREVQKSGWTETYPSSGSYTVALAAGQIAKKKDFGNFHLGTISGMKYDDKNGNGRKNSGDNGLSGWTIKLKKQNGPTVSTVTGANGSYSFGDLGPGFYTLSEVMKPGWKQTDHADPVRVTSGTNAKNEDFGNTPISSGKGKGDNDHDYDDGGYSGSGHH